MPQCGEGRVGKGNRELGLTRILETSQSENKRILLLVQPQKALSPTWCPMEELAWVMRVGRGVSHCLSAPLDLWGPPWTSEASPFTSNHCPYPGARVCYALPR